MAGVAADLFVFHALHEEEIQAHDFLAFCSDEFDPEIFGPDPFSSEYHLSPPSHHSLHEPILTHDSSDEDDVGIVELSAFNIVISPVEDPNSNFFAGQDLTNLAHHLFDEMPRGTNAVDCTSARNPFLESLGSTDCMVFMENDEMGSSDLLEFGLGFGDEELGDGLFTRWRNLTSQPGESSRVCVLKPFPDGLRIVGLGSDSDSEDNPLAAIDLDLDSDGGDVLDRVTNDLDFPLDLNSLYLDDTRVPNEDLDWEEVDIGIDEAVLSMMVGNGIEEDEGLTSAPSVHENVNAGFAVEATHNPEWEVLLPEDGGSERDPIDAEYDTEPYYDDHSEYTMPVELDVLLGQFMDNDISSESGTPAAKSVIENLQTVVMTQEDKESNNTLCAICKDEISLDEQAKRLPCSHHYHGGCILPWLRIRNTCPVCRYELPKDDNDYQQSSVQREDHHFAGESESRYGLQMLYEEE